MLLREMLISVVVCSVYELYTCGMALKGHYVVFPDEIQIQNLIFTNINDGINLTFFP